MRNIIPISDTRRLEQATRPRLCQYETAGQGTTEHDCLRDLNHGESSLLTLQHSQCATVLPAAGVRKLPIPNAMSGNQEVQSLRDFQGSDSGKVF